MWSFGEKDIETEVAVALVEDNYYFIMQTTQGAAGLQGRGCMVEGGKGSLFGMCLCQSGQSESSLEGNLEAQIILTMSRAAQYIISASILK